MPFIWIIILYWFSLTNYQPYGLQLLASKDPFGDCCMTSSTVRSKTFSHIIPDSLYSFLFVFVGKFICSFHHKNVVEWEFTVCPKSRPVRSCVAQRGFQIFDTILWLPLTLIAVINCTVSKLIRTKTSRIMAINQSGYWQVSIQQKFNTKKFKWMGET